MERLELAEAVKALRTELAHAAAVGAEAGLQFLVVGIQMESHVAVTRTGAGSAGVKFWVMEAGGSGSYTREEIQTVTVTLGPPADRSGEQVRIHRNSVQKP